MILYSCSPPDDAAIELAKEWIKENGYTRDDVRLIKTSKYIAVEEIRHETIRN